MRKLLIIVLLFSFFTSQSESLFAHGKQQDKKGILLVTFGTSYPEARKSFTNIEEKVRIEFPGVEIRWAYTSKIIRSILKKRGESIDSPAEALAKMGEDGFTHVAVQSLHVIPGEEYENLYATVMAFNKMPKGIQVAVIGQPLLYSHPDNKRLASFVDHTFHEMVEKKKALVFMGHGTHHQSNIYYPGFQYYLNQYSDAYLMATVEGYPSLSQVIAELKTQGVKNVTLSPFMSVAGDHARNDMAGDEEDSWKSILEKEGFEVEIILKGLAEYDEVVNVWVDHLKEVYASL
jgi:sirohydrochlorin cobaltochelatase